MTERAERGADEHPRTSHEEHRGEGLYHDGHFYVDLETISDPDERTLPVRILRFVIGVHVVIAGILMLLLPGPGVVTVIAGLVLISPEVPAAERLVGYLRKKTPGIPDDGSIPRSAWATMAGMVLFGIAGSVWWYVIR